MPNPKPTIDEQITALHVLREFALTIHAVANPTDGELEVMEAIDTLDNANYFADLDAEAYDREVSKTPRTPVAIEQNGPLWQARGVDGHIWSTATTYKKVEDHLAEQPTAFLIVLPADLPKHEPLDPAEGGDTTHEDMARHQIGLPTLAPGEEIRPGFSDTHPRAARELGEMIAHNEQHADTYTIHPAPEANA